MASSFRSQHSSDRKHEYSAVITTDKPVTYQESKCGGGEEGRALWFPSTRVLLSEKGRSQHPQPPFSPCDWSTGCYKSEDGNYPPFVNVNGDIF